MRQHLLAMTILLSALFSPPSYASPPPGALEQFELSSLKLMSIANLPEPCHDHAYIEDPNGYWHIVMVGTHLGKRNGVVREISPDGLHIVEIVQDGRDHWKESEVILKFASQQPTASQPQRQKQ